MIKNLFALSILLTLVFSNAFSQSWEKNSGWSGISQYATVYSINDTLIAVDANKHLYKSADLGLNWNAITTPEGIVKYWIFDSRIFIQTYGFKLYSSSNSGQSWTLLTIPFPETEPFLSSDEYVWTNTITGLLASNGKLLLRRRRDTNADDFYWRDSIYVSNDNGQSWNNITAKIPLDAYVGEPVVPITIKSDGTALYGSKLYEDTDAGIVYISNDNGNLWLEINLDSIVPSNYKLEKIITFKGQAYLSIKRDSTDSKYYKITNTGAITEIQLQGIPDINTPLTFLSTDVNHLFIYSKDGLYLSTNKGNNFTTIDLTGLETGAIINSIALSGSTYFLGTDLGIFENSEVITALNNQLNESHSSVSPNPFSDRIRIDLKSNQFAQINLLDNLNNIVYSQNYSNNETQIEINNLPSTLPTGLYFLQLTYSDGKSETTKLIKQ